MKRILVLIAVVLAIKVAKNSLRYLQCRRYLHLYIAWLRDKKDWRLTEAHHRVETLLRDAGIEDTPIPHIEGVGYGRVAKLLLSVIANFPSDRQDMAGIMIRNFHRAAGVHRSRVLETSRPWDTGQFLYGTTQLPHAPFGFQRPNT